MDPVTVRYPEFKTGKAIVAEANNVRITDVLRDHFGNDYVPNFDDLIATGRSWKTMCPFAFEHADPLERSLRIHADTNSVYCHDGHGHMNVVRLIQRAMDLPPIQAANYVLDHWETHDPTEPPVSLHVDTMRDLLLKRVSRHLPEHLPDDILTWPDCNAQILNMLGNMPQEDASQANLKEWLDSATAWIVSTAVDLYAPVRDK